MVRRLQSPRSEPSERAFERKTARRFGPPVLLVLAAVAIIMVGASLNRAQATSTTSVAFSYTVVGQGTGYRSPLITYFVNGVQHTSQLSRSRVNFTMDVGSLWNVSSILPGSNTTYRWSPPTTTGFVVPGVSTIVTYYRQVLVTMGFSVADGSSFIPAVNTTSYGTVLVNQQAGFEGWVDLGSKYSYSGLLTSSNSEERWITTDTVSGIIGGPASFDPVYYHQYLVDLQYRYVGGVPPTTPTLQGLAFNTTVTAQLTSPPQSPTPLWMDAQSAYNVTANLPSSNPNERWSIQDPSGVIRSPGLTTFTYYDQFTLAASYQVTGGESSGQPVLGYFSWGSHQQVPLTETPTTLWADLDTVYSVPGQLPGGTSDERWVTKGAADGIVTGATTFSPDYYHQYSIILGFSKVGKGSLSPPFLTYYSFGLANGSILGGPGTIWADNGSALLLNRLIPSSANGTEWLLGAQVPQNVTGPIDAVATYYLEVQARVSFQVAGGGTPNAPVFSYYALGRLNSSAVQSTPQSYWLDSGTPWTVSQHLQKGGSERWALEGSSDNGTASKPFALGLTYQHQYSIQVSVGKYGGGTVPNISGWYSPGTTLTLSATPSQGWKFGTWSGSPGLSTAPASLVVQGPVNETAIFDPGLQVTPGNGGSVVVAGGGFTGHASQSSSVVVYLQPGTNVTILASPSSSLYIFSSWSSLPSSYQNPTTFNLVKPMVIDATFEVSYLSLAVLSAGIALLAIGVILGLYLLRKRNPKFLRGLGTGSKAGSK